MDFVREAFEAASADGEAMRSAGEWRAFVQRLQAAGLGDARLRGLWARLRPFEDEDAAATREGVALQDVLERLAAEARSSAPAALRRLDADLDALDGQMAGLVELTQRWSPEDAAQVGQLLKLAAELQAQHDKAAARVAEAVERQRAALLSAAGPESGCGPEETHFQARNAGRIEKACSAARVRGPVAFVDPRGSRRSNAYALADKLGLGRGLTVALASSSRGQLVEAVQLESGSAEQVAAAYVCHAAHRELILSQHVPDWMGYSARCELFYEHVESAASLETLVRKHGVLVEPQPLLRWVLAETLDALCELEEQSTFRFGKLSAANVFVGEDGARLVLGRIPWRDKPLDPSPEDTLLWHQERRVILLRALASVVETATGARQRHSRPERDDDAPAPSKVLEFGRAQSDAGLRVLRGDQFRLALPTTTADKVWRCVKIADVGDATTAETAAAQVVRLEAPDRLIFSAAKSGVCRLFLKEAEWWQDAAAASEVEAAQGLGGASLMVRVSVGERGERGAAGRDLLSPACRALLAACSRPAEGATQVRLRDLQDKYEFLQPGATSAAAAAEDFAVFTA